GLAIALAISRACGGNDGAVLGGGLVGVARQLEADAFVRFSLVLIVGQIQHDALALPRLRLLAEVIEQPLGGRLVELELPSGLDEVEDVLNLAKHLHLLIEMGDGVGDLPAAAEIGDFVEAFGRVADAFGKCAHRCLPVERGGWEGKTNARSSSSRTSTARSP